MERTSGDSEELTVSEERLLHRTLQQRRLQIQLQMLLLLLLLQRLQTGLWVFYLLAGPPPQFIGLAAPL